MIEILEASGVGLPDYYRWRSRSGCTFCFYQQKIEWVRLMEEHPEAFAEAKRYEKNAVEHGSPFTWSQGESLEELSQPARIAAIRADHQRRVERTRMRTRGQVQPHSPPYGPCSSQDLRRRAWFTSSAYTPL